MLGLGFHEPDKIVRHGSRGPVYSLSSLWTLERCVRLTGGRQSEETITLTTYKTQLSYLTFQETTKYETEFIKGQNHLPI